MTKNEPGKFDCYAKATDDEPLFTLRAKDPVAPHLVRAWRYLRAGMLTEATYEMTKAKEALKASGRTKLPLGTEKSIEAAQAADAMEEWLRTLPARTQQALLIAAEEGFQGVPLATDCVRGSFMHDDETGPHEDRG